MKYLAYPNNADSYSVAILVKPSAFRAQDIESNYINALQTHGVSEVLVTPTLGGKKTFTAKEIKEYLTNVLPKLESVGTKLVYVTEGTFFKVLTKKPKAEPYQGYVLPCALEGHEHLRVVLGLNYQQLIYNPDLEEKLDRSLQTVADALQGTYTAPGANIIHSAQYPKDPESIRLALLELLDKPELSCDIEAFSLRFEQAGIGTIAFAWDQHNGIAFPVDYEALDSPNELGEYGRQTNNTLVKTYLREFFTHYKGNLKGKVVFHNAAYDVKVIIYELWMKDALDTEGLLAGLDTMTTHLDDTKIIAYLAYNSTAGNVLGLKPLAHEFAGNYAMDDIKDIRRIPLDTLLTYNLVDALCAHYVKARDYPKMVQDCQENLYHSLMLPSLKLIIQVELSGMPLSMDQVLEAEKELQAKSQGHFQAIQQNPLTLQFNHWLQVKTMNLVNAKLKKKQHPLEKFADVTFNPNSGPQLQDFLYDMLGLPVLDYTESKAPATGTDTLIKLTQHTQDANILALLNDLVEHGKVEKILTAFIPSFKKAQSKGDMWHYLHGSFNLGGTVSGRLSSSNPNLQQLPSGSTYGKLIKKCFKAPPGWIFCGADFSSLEDYISALTTKDPNKLKVYEGLNQYDLLINGNTHRINENTIVEFEGINITGKELYEILKSRSP